MSGVLYTFPNNFRAHKALVAAEYSGFKIEQGEFVAGQTEKSESFLSKFPLGKVPAFVSGDLCLNEVNAIAHFVGNAATREGSCAAQVLNWVGFAENVIEPAACTWVYPTLGMMQYNKMNTENSKAEVKKAMEYMNAHLSTRTYLVGERVSQADISVACTMAMLYQHVMDASFREAYVNVNRWFNTCVNQKEFKAVLGEVTMCTKMAQFDSKKYNEIFGKAKKDAAPKKAKKENQKPKAGGDNKPKFVTAAAAEAAAAASGAPAKKTDPWVDSPKATMDMDAWKRMFSNEKDPAVYLKYFHEHFPADNYSVWRGQYMYNDELALDFLANNLVNGMFQRLEKLRKHAFGSVCLLKDADGKLEIDGLWIFRGHKLAFELCDDWKIDYETYKWQKLDYALESTKKTIDTFFTGEGVLDGKDVYDMNVYK